MRRVIFLLLFFFQAIGLIKAQSSTSFSTFLSNDNPQIHFVATIGDVFISTLNNEQNMVSQGYLQKEIDYIISVPEENLPGFSLYPNPTSGKIYFGMDINPGTNIEVKQIEIFDYSGKLVYRSANLGSISRFPEMDFSNLDAGIYMVHIYFNNKQQAVRIVKI